MASASQNGSESVIFRASCFYYYYRAAKCFRRRNAESSFVDVHECSGNDTDCVLRIRNMNIAYTQANSS